MMMMMMMIRHKWQSGTCSRCESETEEVSSESGVFSGSEVEEVSDCDGGEASQKKPLNDTPKAARSRRSTQLLTCLEKM